MKVVWYRLRVSESQRHTPIKIFPSTPPGGSSSTPYRFLLWTPGQAPAVVSRLASEESYKEQN